MRKWYGDQDPARDYRPEKVIYSELRFLGCPSDEARHVVREVVRMRGGSSRRDILIARYRKLLAENYDKVSVLLKEGPQGSPNAYRAAGWVKSPAMAISAAAKKADPLLWADGWRGGGATPECLIPEVLYEDMVREWKEVYL